MNHAEGHLLGPKAGSFFVNNKKKKTGESYLDGK